MKTTSTTSPGLIQLLIGHTVLRPIGCLRRLIGQFNFAGAITVKTFDRKNFTDLLHLLFPGALRALHVNIINGNNARCQISSFHFIFLLLCALVPWRETFDVTASESLPGRAELPLTGVQL